MNVVCDDCGEEIPEENAVPMMDLGSKEIKALCMDCYYKELAKEQEEKEACDGDD